MNPKLSGDNLGTFPNGAGYGLSSPSPGKSRYVGKSIFLGGKIPVPLMTVSNSINIYFPSLGLKFRMN